MRILPDFAVPTEGSIDDPDIFFQCQRCTKCCSWEGEVVVTEDEIQTIAEYLNLHIYDFVSNYTALRDNRKGLTIIDHPGTTDCIFLKDGGCEINDVKPEQCRGFPNKWNFPNWQDYCEAKPIPVKNRGCE